MQQWLLFLSSYLFAFLILEVEKYFFIAEVTAFQNTNNLIITVLKSNTAGGWWSSNTTVSKTGDQNDWGKGDTWWSGNKENLQKFGQLLGTLACVRKHSSAWQEQQKKRQIPNNKTGSKHAAKLRLLSFRIFQKHNWSLCRKIKWEKNIAFS